MIRNCSRVGQAAVDNQRQPETTSDLGERVGRPERPLDGRSGPLREFASQLRRLRERSGCRSYRQMAASANFGAATLAKAASGSRLPSWEITRAYVTACGGDLKEWRARWESAAQRLTSSGETGGFALGTGTPARGGGGISGA